MGLVGRKKGTSTDAGKAWRINESLVWCDLITGEDISVIG